VLGDGRNARPGAVRAQGRRNADAAHRACRRRATKSMVRDVGVAARRRHAPCEAAKVLGRVSVRSAPMIGGLRRLRAVRALPAARPRRAGAPWSGAAEVETVRIEHRQAPVCVDCSRRPFVVDAATPNHAVTSVRAREQGRPLGRAQASEAHHHRCAADGTVGQCVSRGARRVTTARARSPPSHWDLGRAPLARAGAPAPAFPGPFDRSPPVAHFVRRRARPRGLPLPAPGGGHVRREVTNDQGPALLHALVP